MQPSQLPCYLILLRPKSRPQHPILETLQPMFVPECEVPSFTPLKATGRTVVPYTFIFIFLDSKLEEKHSALNDNKHCLPSTCSSFFKYNFYFYTWCQIFDLFHLSRRYFTYLCILILSLILFTRLEHVLCCLRILEQSHDQRLIQLL
jgi:hypothetical protein